jgi:(2S)-methylsuccinyl-CoA dehydrogenase
VTAILKVLDDAHNLLRRCYEHLARHCLEDDQVSTTRLDEHQSECYDLAWCSARVAAAQAILQYLACCSDSLAVPLGHLFIADSLQDILGRLSLHPADYGLAYEDLQELAPARNEELLAATSAQQLRRVGQTLVERQGVLPPRLLDSERELIWESFARFASNIITPRAQRIHCSDSDIPEDLLKAAAEVGLFRVSVPQRFGGLQPDDRPDALAMVVATEALSQASLGVGGSLVTRPEILVRVLLAGGTPEQQRQWLPQIASGIALCAVSVSEPDFGSDVASLRLRATRLAHGWRLNGAKTWCTFAGRANVLLVLARSDPDVALGRHGLSLFLVEKPAFPGHEFSYASSSGGRLTGRAIPTIGYRGMHSFELFFDDLVLPPEALVGGPQGERKGFYFMMKGFAGGRVQTAARANGLMLAAWDASVAYARTRKVFGKTLAECALTQVKLARMAAALVASQRLTYATAELMGSGGGGLEASLVKLLASRTAEWICREAMQLHGGFGYASNTPVSRLFVDARVLSIFEGTEETLALKVIAREFVTEAARLAFGESRHEVGGRTEP